MPMAESTVGVLLAFAVCFIGLFSLLFIMAYAQEHKIIYLLLFLLPLWFYIYFMFSRLVLVDRYSGITAPLLFLACICYSSISYLYDLLKKKLSEKKQILKYKLSNINFATNKKWLILTGGCSILAFILSIIQMIAIFISQKSH